MKRQTIFLRTIRFFAILAVLYSSCMAKGCVDENGDSVDWYVALRVPNSRRYLVYTSTTKQFRSTSEILLEKIVGQLSFTQGNIRMWNDQTVEKTASSSKAHAKGFVHHEEGSNGFVYIHSIPHFVDTTGLKFSSLTRETSMYAQSMVCLTIESREQAVTILRHVDAQNSFIYEDTFKIDTSQRTPPPVMNADLTHGFKMVTKTTTGDIHPFEDLLAGVFNTGWLVNTWARPYKPSTCTGSKKISNISVKNMDGVIMKITQDHGKWALSYGDNRRIVCVGDLNHMDSQLPRGGSFLCIDNADLYKAFYSYLLNDDCQIVQNFKP